MTEFVRGKVTGAGRVVIPAEFRKEYHIEDGEEVLFSRSEYGIQLMPLAQAVRRAQEMVKKYVPAEVNLSEELHQARRKDSTFD